MAKSMKKNNIIVTTGLCNVNIIFSIIYPVRVFQYVTAVEESLSLLSILLVSK